MCFVVEILNWHSIPKFLLRVPFLYDGTWRLNTVTLRIPYSSHSSRFQIISIPVTSFRLQRSKCNKEHLPGSSAVEFSCSHVPVPYPYLCRYQGAVMATFWSLDHSDGSKLWNSAGSMATSWLPTLLTVAQEQLSWKDSWAVSFWELFLEAQSRACFSSLQFCEHLTPYIKYPLLKIEWWLFSAPRLMPFPFL